MKIPSAQIRALPAKLFLTILLVTGATSLSHAQQATTTFDFENIPDYIPDWGGGFGDDYKSAAAFDAPFKVTLDKADPHSGLSCLHIALLTAPQKTVRVFSPSVTIPANAKTVALDFFVRTKGLAEAAASVGLLEHDAKAPLGYVGGQESLKTIPLSDGWSEVKVSGPVDTGAVTAQVMFTVNANVAAGDIWLDDLSVQTTP